MGKLYDYCNRIQQHIESNNLDVFKSRGELAIRCGFLITLVGPEDPDVLIEPTPRSSMPQEPPRRQLSARLSVSRVTSA